MSCAVEIEPTSTGLARLLASPRVELGTWPTPLERVTLPGLGEIWAKRDDLSGYGRGGAKTRKIEHLIGHLLANEHDELVAVTGNVTNLAFDLLPALDRFGIRASLFIIDDPPLALEARERIFAGIRGRVQLMGASRAEVFTAMQRACWRARRAGRRPFFALPGASHPSGVIGNAVGFLEIAAVLAAQGGLPDTVFVSAATGTTLAGFLLAEHALRRGGYPPMRVLGVQVYPGRLRAATWALLRWTEHALGIADRVPCARIQIDDSELGAGFGRFTPELADLCDSVEQGTGLVLDPFFGGKTWAVMQQQLRRAGRGARALYWHCGFTPEWRVLGGAVARARTEPA
jgi:1-aminocyclopropane-1-carboxylate deaminase/D-cysteine desulfhydrase-like pyridoxal-dependent ACC family enzyme